DDHLFTLCRYVERNPLRAKLVHQAETWRWESLWHRAHGTAPLLLDEWPLPIPDDCLKQVNAAQSEAEIEAVRRALQRGNPYGEEACKKRPAKALGLKSTLSSRGRPRKPEPGKA